VVLQRKTTRGFARAGTTTVLVTAMTLVLNVLTGVMVARALGPDGRGALTASLTAPYLIGWVLGMGCGKAVTFFLSRNPTLGAPLFTSWLVFMIPIGAIAVTIGEISLPWLLSAQPDETLRLAHLYMPTIVLVLLSDLVLGMVLGDQDFLYYNAMTLVQPIGAAAVYPLLWLSGHFTVATALLTQAIVATVMLAFATIHVVRRHGLAWPNFDIWRRTFWYALRAHGEIISGTISQRLDLLIIPAFLTASSVGFYAIATNVSWIIVNLAASLSTILMPAATHRAELGRSLVIKSLHTTFVIGIVLGGGLFLFAGTAIRIVYGAGFLESVLPLRILLPGAVVYAAACVFINGLYAENRPFTATLAQTVGMAVTVIGLLTFLRSGGILAAAIVSTVAYSLVFVASGILYLQATGLKLRALVPHASDVRAILHRLLVILHLAPYRIPEDVGTQKPGE
jgi:O-antigen/teichoic acid export membrane protein